MVFLKSKIYIREGTSLQNSGIEFAFKHNAENVMLCEMYLWNCGFDN